MAALTQLLGLPGKHSACGRRFATPYLNLLNNRPVLFQVLFFALSASLFAASLIHNDFALFSGNRTAGCSKPSRFLIGDHGFPGPVPWQWIRPSLRDEFTLEGKIQVTEWFRDTGHRDSGVKPNVWTNEKIEAERDMARARNPNFGNYMPEDTAMFFKAFEKHPIKGKSVLVIGSQWPWVEAICLAFDSGMITTVDFNKPIAKFPGMRQISVAELEGTEERFDVAVSYSSLEHDGLGRYGDPINPNGDLERMEKIRGLVKPNGLFFLGVPVGNDTIVYNAHRIYGPIRMPLLISGWKLLDVFGGKTLDEIYRENLNQQVIQPLVVLSLES